MNGWQTSWRWPSFLTPPPSPQCVSLLLYSSHPPASAPGACQAYGEEDYLIFDCPGQIELYSHTHAFRSFIKCVWPRSPAQANPMTPLYASTVPCSICLFITSSFLCCAHTPTFGFSSLRDRSSPSEEFFDRSHALVPCAPSFPEPHQMRHRLQVPRE